MAFDENKYRQIFESRFGPGSFNSGLSQARKVGQLQAQAELAKSRYDDYVSQSQNKTYNDALGMFGGSVYNENAELQLDEMISNPKKNGAARNAETIRNDPSLQEAVKNRGLSVDEFIDAMYNAASGGQFRSERQYGGFADEIAKQAKKRKDEDDDILKKYNIDTSVKSSSTQPKEKQENKFLADIFTPLKQFGKGVSNVFDGDKDTEFSDAFAELVDIGMKTERSPITKELTRALTRTANTGSLGALDQIYKATNDGQQAGQFSNEGRSTAGKVADFGYDALGYLIPGGKAYKVLNSSKLGKGLTQFGSQGIKQRLASEGAKGALTGGGLAGAEVGIREGLNPDDYTAKDNLIHLGIGVGAGAVADPLLYGAGKLAQNGLSRLAKGDVPTFSGAPSESVVNNLPNSNLGRVSGQSDDLFNRLSSISRNNSPTQTANNARNEVVNLSQQVSPNREVAATIQEVPRTQSTERLQPGRDFEPIEASARANNGGELARVSDDLLDTQRQSQGNADTFRAKVDRKPKKQEGLFSNLRTQFIDDMAPLEKIEKQIAGKVGSAENSLYKTARTFRGSAEKANLIVEEQLTPVIRQVQKSGYKLEDLGDYALAVHAKDVNEKGINSGFTNAEIEDVIRKLGTPEMEQARQQLKAVNDNVLDILSTGDAPVLNPSDVQVMKEKWPNYMSLFRSFDDDKVEFASGISKAMSVGSSPIQRLQGSNRNVIDPMESIVKNIYKATNTADRNKVASQLGKLAEKDTQGLIRKLADGEDAGRVNVISMMDKGQKVKYEVPPDVYKAMKNLDQESTNTLIQILQKPASWLRSGATLTPEFSLRNPLRDVPNAFIVSESGFNPLVDFPVGLWQSIWKGRTIKIGNKEFKTSGDLYKQFIKENGGYGNIVSMDRELHRKTLKKALTESSTKYVDVLDPKTYGAIIKKMSNPIGVLRNVADISETATKVGEFRAALRKGATPQEAAYRARDIMDFARAGVSVREANKVVAFLNANIQGKSKLWRAFKENPAKVGGKAIAAVTIPTIGAIAAQEHLANDKQKQVLDDAPQWLKDTFYLVPIPGTDQIARIPKPFDLAYPFSNTLERAFDYVKKNDKDAFDGFMKQAFSAASVPVMLTGLAPIVEGMANYSFFRQSSIIPQREQNMEFPDQYDVNTSEFAKLVGKGVNKITEGQGAFRNFGSPRVVDNTVQGLTGGLGTYGVSVADGVINYFMEDADKPERPAKNLDQKPLAKAFLVNQSGSGESLDKLYTLKEKLTKARGSWTSKNEKDFPQEELYDDVNELTKVLSEINKEIRTVENHKDISAQQKRQILDQLIQQRNQFARQAVQGLEWSE